MKVTALVENSCSCGLDTEHGLSLYIETAGGLRILFDMGQGPLFAKNASLLGKDLAAVDMAVISHGHYDHGGGLSHFLDLNSRAKVYLNRYAFDEHFSMKEDGLKYIGLNRTIPDNPKYRDRIVLCGDVCEPAPGLKLFTCQGGPYPRPEGNSLLFGPDACTRDDFRHEQNLIIEESGKAFLFAGCAHQGVENIVRMAEEVHGGPIGCVFAGMHLIKDAFNAEKLERLARNLLSADGCRYFTMHCTGQENYQFLKTVMHERLDCLSCGETWSDTFA